MYVIEFQKRGLPHMLITLKYNFKIIPEVVDKYYDVLRRATVYGSEQ